jgi:hypothetical protein
MLFLNGTRFDGGRKRVWQKAPNEGRKARKLRFFVDQQKRIKWAGVGSGSSSSRDEQGQWRAQVITGRANRGGLRIRDDGPQAAKCRGIMAE